jgi:hypothetical protein
MVAPTQRSGTGNRARAGFEGAVSIVVAAHIEGPMQPGRKRAREVAGLTVRLSFAARRFLVFVFIVSYIIPYIYIYPI